MRVLFFNPPFLRKFSRFSRSPAVTKSGTIYFPNWHAYAAGWLEKKGHEVILLDAPARGLDRAASSRIISGFKPDIAVVYTSTPSIYNDVEVAGDIKESMPGCYVVLTGPHVSALPEETLNLDSRVDAVARGEYDATIENLAAVLPDASRLASVKGLSYRAGAGISHNPDREFIEDLDSFPFVAEVYKKHLKVEDYFYAHCRFPVISIFTSRGCYAKCNYCVYPEKMFGRRQRQRSPENIVAEFEYIQRELPEVKEVLIDDDTFSFHQEHTKKFCELMLAKGIKLPWTVECRANLSYEIMALMKKAGCRLIVVGFESADDEILKNVKKGINVEQMRKFVGDAKRAGVMLHSCFMAGNPGETRQTLEKSLAFAKEINADTCQFFPLMVYPGTAAYTWAKQNKYLETEDFSQWLTSEGLHNTIISTPELSARDLVAFCDRARKEYYLRPAYIARKLGQALTDPHEFLKTAKAAKTFFKYLFRKTA